jgi:fructokinase
MPDELPLPQQPTTTRIVLQTTTSLGAAPSILVIGEALIDIVECDGESAEHVGGSPANVALTLARLGRNATLVTDIADDDRGRRIAEHLNTSGVSVMRGDSERTSTARAILCEDGSAEYVFDLSWNPPAADPSSANHVHTGSIAIYLEPGGSQILEMIQTLPAGVTASVDANIRPALIGKHQEALARFEQVAAACEIVKLSDEDAEWLYPTMQIDEVLSRLLELGAQLAVITRGGKGLLLASSGTRVTVPAVRTVVADTIGAGDSAMGAILDEAFRQGFSSPNGMLLDEPSLGEIGSWAARVAAITTSRFGANPPTRAEL